MYILQFIEAHPYFSICAGLSSGAVLNFFSDWLHSAIDFLIGLFWVRRHAVDRYTGAVIYDYLNAVYKGFGVADETYEAKWEHVRPLEDEYSTWYRNKGYSTRLWFKGIFPIILWPSGKDSVSGDSGAPVFRYLRWTVNWDKLIKAAGEHRDKKLHLAKEEKGNKFKIIKHTGTGSRLMTGDSDSKAPQDSNNKGYSFHSENDLLFWKPEDIGNPRPDDPIGFLSINEAMAKVIKRVKFWFNDKDWYKERGLIWKLGILLYGKPGGGKTSLIRALAEELDIPMHVFDLPSLDNYEFTEAWQSSQSDKPRIVVFEDWDTVFHGRKNMIADSNLDLSTILNLIDGVEREHGLLLFITTNKVQFIDEAVGAPREDDPEKSTRPGRIDMCVKLEALDKAGREKIANRILKDKPEIAKEMVTKYAKEGAVQFQDRCIVRALELYWEERQGKAA